MKTNQNKIIGKETSLTDFVLSRSLDLIINEQGIKSSVKWKIQGKNLDKEVLGITLNKDGQVTFKFPEDMNFIN